MGNKESAVERIDSRQRIMSAAEDHRVKRKQFLLTARQKDLLRKSWRHSHSTGFDSAGSRIFRKIFATDPSIGILFGLNGVEVKDLAHNPKFQPHADTLTKTVTFIVSNLGNMEKINERAQALGARHVKFEHRGFKISYWDVFAEAMTECAVDWERGVRCREAMHAWRLLVIFFIDQMRLGFEQERRKNSYPSASSSTTRDAVSPSEVEE